LDSFLICHKKNLFLEPQHPNLDNGALTQQVLHALQNQLAHFKCPQDIRIIDKMPRTSTGKTPKYKLQQLLEKTAT